MTNDTGQGTITAEVQSGIQVIRMVRKDKKNALSQSMYGALTEAFENGDQDADIKVHLLTGSDGVFTSGNDIGDFLAQTNGGRAISKSTNVLRFINALPEIKKPVVAAVDGPAIGIGTTLLLHCDLIFATPESVFQTPFVDLGLVPEAASSLLMPQRLGYNRAFEMLVMSDVLSAQTLHEAGFVSAVVAPDALMETAMKAASRLAAKPDAAVQLARTLMRGDLAPIRSRMAEETQAFIQRLGSKEARAAFEAFLSKGS
jgi:enoyl-CoA hydratase/carnithine racemase